MKPRNHHAHAPIMRKGGVHQRTNASERARDKRALRAELTQTDDRQYSIKATKGRLDAVWAVTIALVRFQIQ